MLRRRHLLASGFAAAALPAAARAQSGGFDGFLRGVEAEAVRRGVPPAIAAEALQGLSPNPRVLELDRHQPEFTLTWAQYKARVLPPKRIAAGQAAYARYAATLNDVWQRYRVGPGVIMGIWGLESNFGTLTGGFNVIDSLATLAYDGRRAAFFRGELLDALMIAGHGDVAPSAMSGSYAGAMGQPQFMPSAYLRYAVDFGGDGRRNIWTNEADVFASIGNYLAHSGWSGGAPWGQRILLPSSFDPGLAGRSDRRPLGQWSAMGVRRADGSRFAASAANVPGAVLIPDGVGGDAFMVYANFDAIRRYNPSDYYALAVGLLGDDTT